jgi:hypothetical protein
MMVAYSFKRQFVALILAGIKKQTIRADRKRHARPGEDIQLYTGVRTKQCRKIGTAICFSVTPVTINLKDNNVVVGGDIRHGWDQLDKFARSDGFDGWPDMRAFWHQNHPTVQVFSGVMIRWEAFRPTPEPRDE